MQRGLSGSGSLTGQLPSSSQNLRFAVDIDKYSTEATSIQNIEIGGIEIGNYNYTPPPTPVDTDGDGLADSVETNTGVYVSPSDTGTDPNNADTDGDGLYDVVETNTGVYVSPSNTGTDPNNADTSGDGFTDYEAISASVDPNSYYGGLLNIVRQNPNRFGIIDTFDPSSIVDMQMGSVGLERATNGDFNMNFDIEMSTDLGNWESHSSHSIGLSVPDQSKTFLRLKVR